MDFLKNRMGELALLFALVLVSIYTGVRLGLLLGLVLTFALIVYARRSEIGKKVAPWLQGVLVVVFLISVIDAYLPRTKNKKDIVIARIDQTVSGLMGDLTETQARDMWDIRKDEKGQKFLCYYDSLLSQSRPQEARDTLNGFLKAWDLDRKEHQSGPGQSLATVQSQPQITPSIGGTDEPIVLYPGTHHFSLKAGQETPKFSFPDCGYYPYSVSSPSYDYEIVYSPRERYHGDPNLRIPEKDNPSFSIVAGRTETITIKVSKS